LRKSTSLDRSGSFVQLQGEFDSLISMVPDRGMKIALLRLQTDHRNLADGISVSVRGEDAAESSPEFRDNTIPHAIWLWAS